MKTKTPFSLIYSDLDLETIENLRQEVDSVYYD